jgi:AraC-like DNA-binding protein
MVGIALPTRNGGLLISGGIVSRVDEIVTHGPGQRMHEPTDGPCHWRTVRLPSRDLLKYGRAMIGRAFDIPPGTCRWRPKREALRRLTRLHDDATRMSKVQPHVLHAASATRGLEQELIAVLIDCMRGKATAEDDAVRARHADVLCRFEDLLSGCSERAPSIIDICAALDVPDRTLRAYCKMHLGMGPHRYLRLRQMQLARRALRDANPGTKRISDIARRYGFDGLGRFAASYCKQFGELPSDTVRRHGH